MFYRHFETYDSRYAAGALFSQNHKYVVGWTSIFIVLQDQQRYEGAGPITRLHIDLVQTLRRPHIAFVRLRAELTETAIAVYHSINNSVKH